MMGPSWFSGQLLLLVLLYGLSTYAQDPIPIRQPQPHQNPPDAVVLSESSSLHSPVETLEAYSSDSNIVSSLSVQSQDGTPILSESSAFTQSSVISETIHSHSIVQQAEYNYENSQFVNDAEVAAVASAVAKSMKKNTPFKNSRLQSFEEWRKENLEKSGQGDYYDENGNPRKPKSTKSKSKPKSSSTSRGGRRAVSGQDMGNMGMVDELEIEPDIFGSGGEDEEDNDVSKNKQYKDRFNYASIDCAATILKTNKEAKGAHNILIENKDSYMLNKCSASKKYVIVELCQDILVDTVAVGTYEFFSSMFRNIRISVSDRYPVAENDWKVLGEFEALSIRDVQYFQIRNPMIWARYIRIDFLTHWGHEFYCPVSIMRVYGTTMMEEYKKTGQNSGKKSIGGSAQVSEKSASGSSARINSVAPSQISVFEDGNSQGNATEAESNGSLQQDQNQSKRNQQEESNKIPPNDVGNEDSHDIKHENDMDATSIPVYTVPNSPAETNDLSNPSTSLQHEMEDEIECPPSTTYIAGYCGVCKLAYYGYRVSVVHSMFTCGLYINPIEGAISAGLEEFQKPKDTLQPDKLSEDEDDNDEDDDDDEIEEITAQESIYQTIMKRIGLLESNATLSMQYIESQTQSLLEQVVFLNVQQETKINQYISTVNSTLLHQLEQLGQFKSHLVSVVVSALQEQRLLTDMVHSEDERKMDDRISMLSDDLRYQKQIGILQAVILLVILLFIILTRGASIDNSPLFFNGIRDGRLHNASVDSLADNEHQQQLSPSQFYQHQLNQYRRGKGIRRAGPNYLSGTSTEVYRRTPNDQYEDDGNDYSYTNNDIQTWRKKMAKQAASGRWLVSSPGSPESYTFTSHSNSSLSTEYFNNELGNNGILNEVDDDESASIVDDTSCSEFDEEDVVDNDDNISQGEDGSLSTHELIPDTSRLPTQSNMRGLGIDSTTKEQEFYSNAEVSSALDQIGQVQKTLESDEVLETIKEASMSSSSNLDKDLNQDVDGDEEIVRQRRIFKRRLKTDHQPKSESHSSNQVEISTMI